MKKNLLAFTLLLTTLSSASCNKTVPSSSTTTSSVTSSTTSGSSNSSVPISTPEKKKLTITKNKIIENDEISNYFAPVYVAHVDEEQYYEDISVILHDYAYQITMTRGDEDVTVNKNSFTLNTNDGVKSYRFVMLSNMSESILKDQNGKYHKVLHEPTAHVDSLELTENNSPLTFYVLFSFNDVTNVDETTRLLYNGVEVLNA